MTEFCESIEAQQWARVCRLLLAALPVGSLREVVCRLAEFWQQLSDAPVAFVSVVVAQQPQSWDSAAAADGPTRFFHCDTVAPRCDVQQVVSQLERHPEFPSVGDLPCQTVYFSDATQRAQGTVLLFGAHGSLPAEWRLMLSDASSKLLEQALLLPTGACEMERSRKLEEAKLRSLAEFAAGAGHEINNPVATISGRVQLLLRNETDPTRRRSLATIGGQAYRVRDMIGDLRLFASPPQPEPRLLNLCEEVKMVLATLTQQAADAGISFQVQADGHVAVWADRTQLCVVISSLVQNSQDALVDGGTVSVSVKSRLEETCRLGVLTVSDHGPGLSDVDREHLFDPFYSGRQAGRGLGFGLSKCWRIVSQHAGRIDVNSEPGKETVFHVYWPAEAIPSDGEPA